ncbi:MAG: O-antigen ligase family protein [Patescibacteria group bacterium]|nr:O-antigen ligase family protein [Patescibacteria group bacterium]
MNYTTYLRWGIIGGLCIALFIPFIAPPPLGFALFGNVFFPYITPKNFAFRIIVELLLLAYVVLAVREPKFRPKASMLMWATLAFVIWMGIATVFSVDPVKSFWSNFERMEGYVGLLHLFVLFVVAGTVLTAEKWWLPFFRVSIAASVLMGFYGVLQLFNHALISAQSGSRVDTTFGNATYLAEYMLIHIFLTLFLFLHDYKSKTARWLYAGALVLQVTTLFFTETRGAALGVLGGLVVMGVYIAWRARGVEWALMRKVALGVLVGLVLAGGVFVAFRETIMVQNIPMLSRLASISLNDPTTMSRFLYIWPMAIKGSLERPVAGWGQENFSYIFNKNYSPAMYAQEQWFDRAHNQFLDWLVAGGIPAFLLYLSLFFLAAWAFFRSNTLSAPEQGALLGLLAAYAFSVMFVFDNLVSSLFFFLILAFAYSLSRQELPRFMFLTKPASDAAVAVVAPIAAVVILGGAWMLNGDGIARAQTLISAITQTDPTGATKDPAQNLEDFKKTLELGTLGYQEVVEQLFQFASNQVAPSTNLNPEVKQEFYTLTRNAGENLLTQRPDDARLELFMGIFLNQFGQHDEALQYLHKALEHSPGKQHILFQIGITYIQTGNTAQALPVLKEAYDLAPDYQTASIYYATGLLYAGQKGAADEVLKERFGTVLHDDPTLLQVYASMGQYDRLIAIWAAKVEKDPTNVDLLLKLANAYFTAGDKAGSIKTLRQIATLRPSMANQVENLISQIESGTLKP